MMNQFIHSIYAQHFNFLHFNKKKKKKIGKIDKRCASMTLYYEKENCIFYFGGKNEKERKKDIHCLNLKELTLVNLGNMNKVRSGGLSGILKEDKIYLYGGMDVTFFLLLFIFFNFKIFFFFPN